MKRGNPDTHNILKHQQERSPFLSHITEVGKYAALCWLCDTVRTQMPSFCFAPSSCRPCPTQGRVAPAALAHRPAHQGSRMRKGLCLRSHRCITSCPKTWELEITNIYYLRISVGHTGEKLSCVVVAQGLTGSTEASAGVAVISRLNSGELPSEPTHRVIGRV